MQSFETIYERAAERKGGETGLAEAISQYGEVKNIADLTDDRLLAEFSKRIFQAGFNWSVIEKKWDGFEDAFSGFDLGRNAMMSDEDLDAHLKNTAIVRHAAKILSIRDNAVFLSDLAAEHGAAARFFEDWPSNDIIGLWAVMKKRGSRLGGTTGQYALRFLGKDCFILGKAVVAALNQAGVIDGAATSLGAQRKIQAAFNDWHNETGRGYTEMSRILACSVPD